MKKLDEIINDLIEFAEANGVLGDGGIDIKIGEFSIHKTIPVTLDKELTKENNKELSAAEKARLRFMNMGNVREEKDASFSKYTEAASEEDVKKALKDIGE